MMKSKIWYGVSVLFLCLPALQPISKAMAVKKIYSVQQLRQILGNTGREQVELCEDLVIDEPIIVRGDKEIYGKGHRIVRCKSRKKIYGGSLFLIQGRSCIWKDITVSGGGKCSKLSAKVFGRLMEVRQGTLVIGRNCVLCDNVNDALAVDGGGALLVGSGGICRMEGGAICRNTNVSRGAGVVVETNGKFIMTGGAVKNNTVRGSGVVTGFDGRGGAIYNEGHVVIRGGCIKGNSAYSYKERDVFYGGAGGALYAAGGSMVQIDGGIVEDNWDDQRTPIRIAGDMSLDKKPILQKIYLEKGRTIQSKRSFRPSGAIFVQPAVYASGICIAKGKNAPFKLVAKKGYILERKNSGYFIQKEKILKKEEHHVKKRNTGKKYHTNKESKKRKTERRKTEKRHPCKNQRSGQKAAPVIYGRKSPFVFYVGETVEPEYLLLGMRAVDPNEGDITERIKVIFPRHINTDKSGRGIILYEVKNRDGIRTRKRGSYRVKKNCIPIIQTVPRYFFLWEVSGYTEQQWKQLLLEECKLKDDCDTSADLQMTTSVEYEDLSALKAGRHEITVTVRDQYGHRFYMKPGERRRYGEGKEAKIRITVILVETDASDEENVGKVRFRKPDKNETIEEEWTFSAREIQSIQHFMDRQKDPFSKEANQAFWNLYKRCRKSKEDRYE